MKSQDYRPWIKISTLVDLANKAFKRIHARLKNIAGYIHAKTYEFIKIWWVLGTVVILLCICHRRDNYDHYDFKKFELVDLETNYVLHIGLVFWKDTIRKIF